LTRLTLAARGRWRSNGSTEINRFNDDPYQDLFFQKQSD
jgi:hypothetical protein